MLSTVNHTFTQYDMFPFAVWLWARSLVHSFTYILWLSPHSPHLKEFVYRLTLMCVSVSEQQVWARILKCKLYTNTKSKYRHIQAHTRHTYTHNTHSSSIEQQQGIFFYILSSYGCKSRTTRQLYILKFKVVHLTTKI